MQTILGANGPIGEELARELKQNFTSDIRLVSRNPKKVNDTDLLFSANLLDASQISEAIKGSSIVYFTAGIPMDTERWERDFPIMMKNCIDACQEHKARLVYFDNTYMYPQDGTLLIESTPFRPVGRKGKVRAQITDLLLHEMQNKNIEAVICRAPEFYGPSTTQSITNTLVFDALKKGKKPSVLLSDKTLRSLIWTPDASRATALIGNTPSAYGQTWHLPVYQPLLTYKEWMQLIGEVYGKEIHYRILPKWAFSIGSLFSTKAKELLEMIPRYAVDTIFDDSKFRKQFPDFKVTTYREGIEYIKKEHGF